MLYSTHKGMTLIEIIVVVVILVVLALIGLRTFSNFGSSESTVVSAQTLASALEEARAKTLSSEGATQYGVHLEIGEDRAILFAGDTYSSGAGSNIYFAFDPRVHITEISTGSPTDIVFQRLTGVPSSAATITLSHNRNGATPKDVVVFSTGLISAR